MLLVPSVLSVMLSVVSASVGLMWLADDVTSVPREHMALEWMAVNVSTLKCLSIGTPKIINFPFISNGKLMIFRCLNIQTDYNEAVLCLNFGTPENNEFSIWDKWKIYYF